MSEKSYKIDTRPVCNIMSVTRGGRGTGLVALDDRTRKELESKGVSCVVLEKKH